jgi:hypothetical protein
MVNRKPSGDTNDGVELTAKQSLIKTHGNNNERAQVKHKEESVNRRRRADIFSTPQTF